MTTATQVASLSIYSIFRHNLHNGNNTSPVLTQCWSSMESTGRILSEPNQSEFNDT